MVILAQEEARILKHDYIDTEHILLGLLREGEGLGARVLESLDVTVERVRAQVVRIVGSGEHLTSGYIPFTPRAQQVRELALREALCHGHEYIGTEHILLWLVREDGGVAASILHEFEVNDEYIRKEVIRILPGPDDHLVGQVRRGNEGAFEVIYERHVAGILSFCRHMLGSLEEAEDAVQHAFAAAHRDLLRDEREIRLKPWLYQIARNRCLSILRARREQPGDALDRSTDGLDDEVERRADLRELVADLQDLPEDQRAALVLSELRDRSYADVAAALGCQVADVKGLIFRARAGLIERREAQAVDDRIRRAER